MTIMSHTGVDHVAGTTFHGRKGSVENRFRYTVDYVLLTPDTAKGPLLFSRRWANLAGLYDSDHGGAPGQGEGTPWVRRVLAEHGLPDAARIDLLAQPRLLGHVFNPVSFWLCHDAEGALRAVIAEVSNTFGDRHSYLVHRADMGPITAEDHLSAQKIFHVSPFQPVEGGYRFRFDIRADRIGIWIDFSAGENGVIATLTGPRKPLTNRAILWACLRRPFGSRRVLTLIFWQALKLRLKGVAYRPRPKPPVEEVS